MNNTKQFIKTFNFPTPDWSELPSDFPNLSKKGLTKEEGHLLDGIKLAWMSSEGRNFVYKLTIKRTFVGTIIFILILLGGILLAKPDKSITKSVNAKTVTTAVGEIIEATMSAVFRK